MNSEVTSPVASDEKYFAVELVIWALYREGLTKYSRFVLSVIGLGHGTRRRTGALTCSRC